MCDNLVCKRCHAVLLYIGNGRPPKYCKRCAIEINKIKEKNRLRRKRSLGDPRTRLWEHRYKDFEKEKEVVQKERKRLKV